MVLIGVRDSGVIYHLTNVGFAVAIPSASLTGVGRKRRIVLPKAASWRKVRRDAGPDPSATFPTDGLRGLVKSASQVTGPTSTIAQFLQRIGIVVEL